MSTITYERFEDDGVTETMLEEAAKLFSEQYGVWSELAEEKLGKFAKAGTHVRLGKARLRRDYLANGISSYVRVTVDDCLAGHAFASRWSAGGKTVCWVTQLVVHRDYRRQGLATGLLNAIRQVGDDVYGIMSSHPAACLTASKAFGRTCTQVLHEALDLAQRDAQKIMEVSPVGYVREAKLRGRLFDSIDASGLVAGVDTEFFVDHKEPLTVLASVRKTTEWPLGDLPEGHEFLVIIARVRR